MKRAMIEKRSPRVLSLEKDDVVWREDSTLSWKCASLSRDAQAGRGMPIGCVLLIPLPSVSRWRRGSLIHSPFMLDCSREYTMSISEQREGMFESDIFAPGGIAD